MGDEDTENGLEREGGVPASVSRRCGDMNASTGDEALGFEGDCVAL
jgi:hypothetical protein